MDTGINMLGQFSESELRNAESTERQQTDFAAMQEGSTSKLTSGAKIHAVTYYVDTENSSDLIMDRDDFDKMMMQFWNDDGKDVGCTRPENYGAAVEKWAASFEAPTRSQRKSAGADIKFESD